MPQLFSLKTGKSFNGSDKWRFISFSYFLCFCRKKGPGDFTKYCINFWWMLSWRQWEIQVWRCFKTDRRDKKWIKLKFMKCIVNMIFCELMPNFPWKLGNTADMEELRNWAQSSLLNSRFSGPSAYGTFPLQSLPGTSTWVFTPL